MEFNTVAIIVVGIIILGCLALWLGRGLKIRKDKNGISLEIDAVKTEESSKHNISIGKDLKIEDSTVGDVAGIKGEAVPDSKQDIDVLNGGKVKNSKLGDIVGVKKQSKPSKEKK